MTCLKFRSKYKAGLQNHAVRLLSLHWAERKGISAGDGTTVSSGGGEAGEGVILGNGAKTSAPPPTHLCVEACATSC